MVLLSSADAKNRRDQQMMNMGYVCICTDVGVPP